jgi:D-3-phosphoglycerate dehydrogenase
MGEGERQQYQEAGIAVSEEERVESTTPLEDFDALLLVSAKVRADVIGRLERCRVIGRYGTGTDNIDVEEATRRGIVVTNVPDFCLSEMADHTIGLILAVTRRLLEMDHCTRSGDWQARVQLTTHRLAGKTLGLVGFGHIARALTRRAHAFDLRILVYKPGLDPAIADEFDVQLTDLDTLMRSSDFVSLHVPLTAQTRHMIGERELRRMRPTAYFINTARGAIVDESALVRALNEGWIAGAGIDVYENLAMFDPDAVHKDHPFFHMRNVILTPHSGGCSAESLQQAASESACQVISVLRGEWPVNCVNPQVTPRVALQKSKSMSA